MGGSLFKQNEDNFTEMLIDVASRNDTKLNFQKVGYVTFENDCPIKIVAK